MVRTIRPHQWVKNLFVLAPIVFARELTRPTLILAALSAFAVFCLLAGAVYTLNDLVDADADRVHPVKRLRPIASGRVPVPLARAMVVGLVSIALGSALAGGVLYHRIAFFVVALGVMLLRVRQPGRARSFRTPFIWVVGPGAMAGCLLLFLSLDSVTIELFFGWAVIGLALYFVYARRRSHIGRAEAAAAQ